MQAFDGIRKAYRIWLDRVAETVIAAIVRVRAVRTVSLIEGDDGQFSIVLPEKNAVEPAATALRLEDGRVAGPPADKVEAALKGARVELVLLSRRFVFKPLELPSRAAEFLDGVVRSQIDRLTPWNAEHAAFGFSAPVDVGSGRIAVTVAATAREMLAPFLQAFRGAGAHSVALLTRVPEGASDAPPISVLQENVGGIFDVHLIRRILWVSLASVFAIAVAANLAAVILDHRLQARQDEVARRIAHTRAAALAARNNLGDPKTLAERALAQRKNESASPVIALEILSQILPDDTYLTELRIDSSKVRLTGITRNAPALIRLIERSHHFDQAIFFAPITHSSSDPGDRFNIEAHMRPDFSLTP
jgi:general secretion pathway protein L